MNAKILTLALVLGLSVVAAVAVDHAWAQTPMNDGYVSVPVIPTDNGDSVQTVLAARQFTLDEGMKYYWQQEQPVVSEGTLLVVEVDPEMAYPRQVGVPVLYVGDTPAQLMNVGYPSGRMIVCVPGHVDLATTPIYFGSTELPERVTRARGDAELAAAVELGIRPFDLEVVQSAVAAGGEPVALTDSAWLYIEAADLILTYAPSETELAELYRLAVK